MSWTLKYVSVSGKFIGGIPTENYDEGFINGAWAQLSSTLPYQLAYSSSGYRSTGAWNPQSNRPNGWDPSADTYPVTLFVLEAVDENQNKTYLKLELDRPGGNYGFSFQVANDLGGPWTVAGNWSSGASMTWAALETRTISNTEYVGVSMYYDGAPYTYRDGIYFDIAEWADYVGDVIVEETSPDYGEASGPGGYDGGTFDDSSDTIGVPAMPSIGVSSIGFVNVYNPSSGALAQLGEDLFPDFTPITPYSPTGNTVIDAITDVAEALANIASNIPNAIEMFNNSQLINYIIDCHIIPVAPSVGSSQSIKIGYKTMNQSAPKVSSDYVDVDCGSLNIGEYYRNFIDYGPYTQAKLFLPFVGFVPIEPELFQSGTLKVVYRFNVIDGSFMAFVLSTSSKSKLTNTVIGQWGGNACVHVPITGINYSNMVSGIAAGVSATVAEIGKGSLVGAADAALNTAAAAPALQSSNGYNATTSFLSVRTPYLMIERSVSHYSKDYGHEQGYPSEITADWSKLSGYTESDAIHLEGLGATEEEMKEIASLLAAGVIL